MLVDKEIPLYYQLETILRKRILSGEIAPNVPFPSEESLGHEYEVSRITVRRALSSLVQDGVIIRKRGKGTFVSEKTNLFFILIINVSSTPSKRFGNLLISLSDNNMFFQGEISGGIVVAF